jgi:hypothetical protein
VSRDQERRKQSKETTKPTEANILKEGTWDCTIKCDAKAPTFVDATLPWSTRRGGPACSGGKSRLGCQPKSSRLPLNLYMRRFDFNWFRKNFRFTFGEVVALSRILGQNKRILTTSRSLRANETNTRHGLGFVNPSTEPATLWDGDGGCRKVLGSTTIHVTLPSPNGDVKNALTTITSIF